MLSAQRSLAGIFGNITERIKGQERTRFPSLHVERGAQLLLRRARDP